MEKHKRIYRSNSLTEEEQRQLIAVIDNYEDLALFKLALHTGIRREDITKIELGGLDLDAKTLNFWEQKKSRFWTVPLTDEVVLELRRYIDTLPKGQRQLFSFTGRTAYNHLQAYLKKAGIKKQLSFHDLRRSFVKTARKRGLSPKAVSQITGDTLRVIQEHYENLDMDELKAEVKLMETKYGNTN